MRERSILFNGAMVRAILSGAKTQTRRVINPQPYIDGSGNFCWNGSNFGQDMAGVPLARTLASQLPSARNGRVLCPFGKIGDRLWVRETWKTHSTFDHLSPREVPPRSNIFYAADDRYSPSAARWRPSIHMPRWACRLVREITDVRVERLQAISEADALAEGIELSSVEGFKRAGMERPAGFAFRELWTSTGGQWDSNPWVWVIEFKRVEAADG